jgi:hypothetical protein
VCVCVCVSPLYVSAYVYVALGPYMCLPLMSVRFRVRVMFRVRESCLGFVMSVMFRVRERSIYK